MENAKCYAPQILVGTEGLPREQWLEYGQFLRYALP